MKDMPQEETKIFENKAHLFQLVSISIWYIQTLNKSLLQKSMAQQISKRTVTFQEEWW